MHQFKNTRHKLLKKNRFVWFLLIGFVASSVMISVDAQTQYKTGYVVTLSGDTLHGKIDYRGSVQMQQQCTFKDAAKNKTTYFPNQIKEFRFVDGKYYVAKPWNDQSVFFEYLVKGNVSFYYLKYQGKDRYFVDKAGESMAEIKYNEGTKQRQEKTYYYESKIHMGVLRYYMQDAPQVIPQIEALEKPSAQNLTQLSRVYHGKVCATDSCIVYEKQTPPVGISVEPFAGMVQFNGYPDFQSEFGAYVYVWAPRMNENLYLKTGVAYHQQPTEDEEVSAYRIPLQLQYVYGAYRVQPKLSAGINLLVRQLPDYTELYNNLTLNLGLNVVLTKSLALSAWFNTDYTSFSQTMLSENSGGGLVSYAISLGLLIQL